MTTAIKINQTHNRNDPNRLITRILTNLSKLAVDSTFNDSLKGVTGPRKLYKIVQERLKRPPASLPSSHCKKPEDAKLAAEMRMKVEKMIEDMAKLNQQVETSAKRIVEETEPVKKGPNEGIKKLMVLEPEKRIFIRSRL
ncbi:uncharacterized protein LOC126666891 [Mercurialis annua]|uniref:uncharacterized protein LOC126666891 n=1 Tax=Mercurialis annua TaxID=3986 RepID=UPI00215FA82E|nr:uncharacterized protein LOC126666891 [Mercurialis annua]